MMNETYTINDAKEKLCFVSTDFRKDMYSTKYGLTARSNNSLTPVSRLSGKQNPIRREYVLPDYVSVLQGFVREPVDRMQIDDGSGVAPPVEQPPVNPDEQVRYGP